MAEPYPPGVTALRASARAWLDKHGDPFPDGDYSTCQNPFLWAAESAFWDELDQWRIEHPPPPDPAKAPRTGCYLYRLWSDDDRLVYVGVSTRLRARLRAHRRRWPDLWCRASWDEHPDAASMLAAERAAIRDEDPALNHAGVG